MWIGRNGFWVHLEGFDPDSNMETYLEKTQGKVIREPGRCLLTLLFAYRVLTPYLDDINLKKLI